MTEIRVAVAGCQGKMGREAMEAVLGADDMRLVAGIDRTARSSASSLNVPIYLDATDCFVETQPDVLIDFTVAAAAEALLPQAVAHGVRPVIGTTGLSSAFLQSLDRALTAGERGGLYAPNFAVGALLMMRAAELAARYLPNVEIVEYHHEGKKDAPSGTAKRTAELVAAARRDSGLLPSVAADGRGHAIDGVPIHSVRLPGYVAHQEVIFGGTGERLTIRHDSMNRTSFMPGVLLGVRSVMRVTGLVEGLEHFLF